MINVVVGVVVVVGIFTNDVAFVVVIVLDVNVAAAFAHAVNSLSAVVLFLERMAMMGRRRC
jgi:hypothetical protein